MSANARQAAEERIRQHYNTANPRIAYCLAGLRRLSVDPGDGRARRMLLAYGPRFLSRQQAILYAINALLPVELYLDVGVNYGECLVALPLYARTRVRGFEANPALHPFIDKTLVYNDDLENVEISGRAMGAVAGEEIDFFVDARWSGKSTAVPTEGASIRKTTAITTTLDAELRDETPDLLLVKLDIEGYEAAAFRGAAEVNRRLPNVLYLMEFDDAFLTRAGEDPAALVEEFGRDFALFMLTGRGLKPIASYADIPVTDTAKGLKHTDLLLAKLTDPALRDRFEAEIADAPMKDLHARLFSW
jgi:FkbM family methyltransferase